ncbi:MAG: BOW99_gp33 family protein [Blautia coccoides]
MKRILNQKKTIKPKITHVMSDGTVRDSIEGVVIPNIIRTMSFVRHRNGILTKRNSGKHVNEPGGVS